MCALCFSALTFPGQISCKCKGSKHFLLSFPMSCFDVSNSFIQWLKCKLFGLISDFILAETRNHLVFFFKMWSRSQLDASSSHLTCSLLAVLLSRLSYSNQFIHRSLVFPDTAMIQWHWPLTPKTYQFCHKVIPRVAFFCQTFLSKATWKHTHNEQLGI